MGRAATEQRCAEPRGSFLSESPERHCEHDGGIGTEPAVVPGEGAGAALASGGARVAGPRPAFRGDPSASGSGYSHALAEDQARTKGVAPPWRALRPRLRPARRRGDVRVSGSRSEMGLEHGWGAGLDAF